jgi:urate oxidase
VYSPVELEVLPVPLIKNRYGKGRVRVMRIHRDGDRHDVSQLNVKAMIEGDFARAYTDADNSTSVSTDTIKNVVNIVARENTGLCTEEFCQVLAKKYLDLYPPVVSVAITAHETKWSRLSIGGEPHPHSFILDSNGKPFVEVTATRDGSTIASGIDGFTFMKSTQSGWENYFKDRYTTIPPTNDRMAATSMVASWKWSGKPPDYPATNAKILAALLEVFSTTYSSSVQDSLYRMGEAALAAVPEISEISMACPNMHFILMNLSAFGLDNNNDVFLPTDEPHGQIECTVGRG